MRDVVRYYETPVRLGEENTVYWGAPMAGGAFPFRTEEKRWGVAGEQNEVLCPPVYDMLVPLNGAQKQLLLACREEKWGLVNARGEEILACRWDEALLVEEDLLALRSGEKWGFAALRDEMCGVIVPAQYGEWMATKTEQRDVVLFVRQDVVWGTMGPGGSGMKVSRWGALDRQGRVLVAPRWKEKPRVQGGTDNKKRVWHIGSVWLETPQGDVALIEDGCRTDALKGGEAQ